MRTNRQVRTTVGRWRRAMLIAALLPALFLAGCQTMQPHVVTKIIVQHEGVSGEVSAEWH